MQGRQVEKMMCMAQVYFQLTARNMKAYPDIEECPDGHDNLMVS